MLTYEDARATVMAADQGEFTLPNYTGGEFDLSYLKNWVLGQVETIYDVTADAFNEATIYSTSILRDFVHRALYQETGREDISDISANEDLLYPQTLDVATAFRYPAYGLCGLMAWQEYQVFRAFGYQAHDIATLNSNTDAYTDSHVTTEVYLTDLDKFIVQDATFNFILEDNDNNPLSYFESRSELFSGDGALTFDSFNNYRDYPTTQNFASTTSLDIQDIFNNDYFKVPYWWYDDDGNLDSLTQSLFPNASSSHDPAANQGGTYADVFAALTEIYGLASAGDDWRSIAQTIRDEGRYVSGFAIANDTQDIVSHWITVRTSDGRYISADIDHHTYLNGSYDQLANNATGGPDLNYGKDLSAFLAPAYLLDYNGNVMDGFVPDPGAHIAEFGDLVLRNVNSGMVKLWDMPDTSNLNLAATLSTTSDIGFTVVGYGDYVGNYGHNILFQKASGQVGIWDGGAHWTNLGTMATGWSIVSSDDHSDFMGDGADDILWHNDATGALGVWNLDNGVNQGFSILGGADPTQWHTAVTNDFNGDGTDDILWQNNVTSELREWIVQNGLVTQNKGLIAPSNSTVIGSADIRHDGSADIIFDNTATGAVGYYNMVDGQNTGYQALGTVAADWTVAAIRDMTADGTADIVWQDNGGHLNLWNLDHASGPSPIVVAQYLGAHASDWIVT